MKIRLHKQARTTPAIRQEIRESSLSERALAEKYHISRSTVRKWKQRQSVEDHSHRPHAIHTALTPAEELFAVALRRFLLLPLDDLHLAIQVIIHAHVSRSALDRCLRRHGISKLGTLFAYNKKCRLPKAEPGVLSISHVNLSPLLTSPQSWFLYLAMDESTHWLYAEIRAAHTAAVFLHNLLEHVPFPVRAVHTEASPEFTVPPTGHSPQSAQAGQHPFAQLCRQEHLSHSLQTGDRTRPALEDFDNLVAILSQGEPRWSVSEAREILFDVCFFFNAEFPLNCLHRRSPLETIQSLGDREQLSTFEAELHKTKDRPQHSCAKSSLEREELIRLRHENRRLRLQQMLLARNKAASGQNDLGVDNPAYRQKRRSLWNTPSRN